VAVAVGGRGRQRAGGYDFLAYRQAHPAPQESGSQSGGGHRPAAALRQRRYGSGLLLLSWLPVVGDPLCVAAGWLRTPWLLSAVLITAGKTARYGVLLFVV